MKFLILLTFALWPSVVKSIQIDCSFLITFDNFYSCTNLNLNIDRNNVEIRNSYGIHLLDRTNDDVLALYLLSGRMKRLPRGLFKVFKNLRKYIVQGLDTVDEFLDYNALIRGDFHGSKNLKTIVFTTVVLEQLRERAFEGADNLNHLTLEACRITSVDKDAFRGLKNLQSLGMKFNYITLLHPQTFSDLVQLKHLLMSGNFIQKLSKEHFEKTRKMQRIALIGNWLDEIDPNLVEKMPEIERLYLDQNLCVNNHFGSDGLPFSKFATAMRSCSKETSHQALMREKQAEIRTLENEIETLQKLVEKYKHQCDY